MSTRSLVRLLPVAMTLVLLGSGAALAVTPLGPEYPLPGGPGTGHGGSTCLSSTDHEGALGHTAAENGTSTDGQTWHFGGGLEPPQGGCAFSATPTALPPFDTTRFDRLFWGLSTAPDLSLGIGPGSGGELQVVDPAQSDLANGVVVWTGTTSMTWCQQPNCASFNTTVVPTKFRMVVTDLAGVPVSLLDPSSVEVSESFVGGLVEVTPALTNFKANVVMLAQNPVSLAYEPALHMYNSFNHPASGFPVTLMSVSGGFRYLSRAPEGSIGGDDPLNHRSTTFSADVTDPDGTIESYAWDLDDDGEFDNGDGPSALTDAYGPGTHTVKVRVTDDDGTQTVLTRDFTIENQPPVASFTCEPTSVPVGDEVTCTSDSIDPDAAPGDPALLHEWLVDGGPVPGVEQVTVSFADPGSHQITLFVTDRDGAGMSANEFVTVEDVVSPVAALTLGKQRLGAIIKSGIKGTLSVDEAFTATLKATIPKKLARKLKIKPVIGTASADAPEAGAVPVTVKLTKAAKRKLKTLGKVAIKVTAVVSDESGNPTTTTATRTYKK